MTTIHTAKPTTIHKRQLQQYTRPKQQQYTQDNLKLTTIHARQRSGVLNGRHWVKMHSAIFHGEGITARRMWLSADTVKCYVFIATATDELVCTEHWWNENWLEFLQRNVSQCHFVDHKFWNVQPGLYIKYSQQRVMGS